MELLAKAIIASAVRLRVRAVVTWHKLLRDKSRGGEAIYAALIPSAAWSEAIYAALIPSAAWSEAIYAG
jgi:hypothetical protein